MAAFLWSKNEKEILKKYILAEAYQEVHVEQQAFDDLDTNSSLYLAIQIAFGGSSGDYVSDKNIKI